MRERDPGLWPLEPSKDRESPLLEALTAQFEGFEGTLRALKKGLSGSRRDSKGLKKWTLGDSKGL